MCAERIQLDHRVGCVAVYFGDEQINCLGHTDEFIFYGRGYRIEDLHGRLLCFSVRPEVIREARYVYECMLRSGEYD